MDTIHGHQLIATLRKQGATDLVRRAEQTVVRQTIHNLEVSRFHARRRQKCLTKKR